MKPEHQPDTETSDTQDLTFTDNDRRGLYKTVFNRRDVRGQFRPDPIPPEVLSRVLYAAHHAPSVGFMQPWNFILVESDEVKDQVHGAFLKANEEAAARFDEQRRGGQYRSLKLEGIREAPLNVCITCDRDKAGPLVLGRTHDPAMDLYSTVCAVQNFWLAARAEGLGVGWVSILERDRLHAILGIPEAIVPVAYLCVGYVDHFKANPELATRKWRQRLPLRDLIAFDVWNGEPTERGEALLSQIRSDRAWAEESWQETPEGKSKSRRGI